RLVRLKERFIMILGRVLRPLPEPLKQRFRLAAVRIGLFGPVAVSEVEIIGSEAAGQAYAQIAAAFSEGRYLEVLSKVEALDASEDALDRRDRYVFRARLARVDTLVASGRAYEALAALDAMDAAYGAGWSTLRRRAQLGLFT